MRLPIGISDFRELILEEYVFADKTPLIKEVMDDGAKVILITRPRRFGKTLNLSMLRYFFQIKTQPAEKNLFADLLISKNQEFCAKHQNKYPVLFLSFKDIKKASFAQAYSQVATLISNLYKEHRYFLEGDCLFEDEKELFLAIIKEKATQAQIENSLVTLAKYMFKKFKQEPIILFDEYDTPIHEAYLSGYYEDMIGLMRGILGEALKDNSHLRKAVITGITRISQESLLSGLNNIEVYSLLREQYGQYFGFLEPEVVNLIAHMEQKPDLAKIKDWYNGYEIGKYILYNPWSILHCLKNNGKIAPYWLNTSSNALLHKLLSKSGTAVKQQLELLLQEQIIEQPLSENLIFRDIESKPEALWSLLLYAGYLKVIKSELGDFQLIAQLAIPNKEVRFVYSQIVSEWFSDALGLKSYEYFTRSLINGDMERFKLYLATYIMQSGSYFDFNCHTPEQIFHIFILGLVVGLRDKYIISSNKESGLGRFDVMFMPKDKNNAGIILEFKTSPTPQTLKDKADNALEQIKKRHYLQELKQHRLQKVLAIGLAFCGKEMDLVHENILLA